jgi:hypothetical protein
MAYQVPPAPAPAPPPIGPQGPLFAAPLQGPKAALFDSPEYAAFMARQHGPSGRDSRDEQERYVAMRWELL